MFWAAGAPEPGGCGGMFMPPEGPAPALGGGWPLDMAMVGSVLSPIVPGAVNGQV